MLHNGRPSRWCPLARETLFGASCSLRGRKKWLTQSLCMRLWPRADLGLPSSGDLAGFVETKECCHEALDAAASASQRQTSSDRCGCSWPCICPSVLGCLQISPNAQEGRLLRPRHPLAISDRPIPAACSQSGPNGAPIAPKESPRPLGHQFERPTNASGVASLMTHNSVGRPEMSGQKRG